VQWSSVHISILYLMIYNPAYYNLVLGINWIDKCFSLNGYGIIIFFNNSV